MEVETSQLTDMGLEAKREVLDDRLGFSKWVRKSELHALVQGQTGTPDKPDADVWFRHEKGSTNTDAVSCNV